MNNTPRQRNTNHPNNGLAQRHRELVAKPAVGRSLSEFLPLLPGEKRLLQACRQGEVATLGTDVPDAPYAERVLRAPFLRFLLLGGDERAPVHEHGTQLTGAFVDGQLNLAGCHVPKNVVLTRCRFTDVLLAQGARMQGVVTLQASYLPRGINANRIQCEGGLLLSDGFKATGEVRLTGAQIGSVLDCSGGQFEVKAGNALSVDHCVVQGSALLSDGFMATGEVRLPGAQIDGNLVCSGGRFEVKEGDALFADGAVVKGSVFFDDGFMAIGTVRFLGAQIGGDLNCSDGQFEVREGKALCVDGAVVKGSVLLKDGFKATGTVGLLGAQVGELACNGGHFEVKKGYALLADRLVVKGHVFLVDGFMATGTVRLLGAQINGNLECNGGQFAVEEGNALVLQSAVVRGGWIFRELERPTSVNAGHMQLKVLVDEISSWGEGSVLDGLRYDALGGGAPAQAKVRLAWLCKQPTEHLGETENGEAFRPQPWRQLQHVLREMGHVEDARQIGIAFELKLRKADLIGRTAPETWKPVAYGKRTIARTVHALFGWLSGYGYRPMRLVFGMTAAWLICGICYWFLALPPHDAIGPSDPLVFQNERYAACVPESQTAASATASGARQAGNWYLCESLPAEYSTFSPLAYSLDVLLPLVDLGQEKSWGPLVPTPIKVAWKEGLVFSPGHVARLLVWFETIFGWVGSLLLVGIVSGVARRSEE